MSGRDVKFLVLWAKCAEFGQQQSERPGTMNCDRRPPQQLQCGDLGQFCPRSVQQQLFWLH